MINQELENAIAIVENWLIPQCVGKRVFFINPSKAQEDLGLTEKIFWFAIFTLIEQQKINVSGLDYMAIYPAAIVLSKHQGSINER
ncbi:hypothetical protein PaVLD_ORF108L [Planktothrix phage PaV-LD]|uniref:hypothetical protein n=1 Tax=Planktothrix phage PaV-LD TaxID=994601 RepID=UPI000243C93B|nr:hypothetical protein PaVLD_ORF108L [Planktothrix phage PaV-LD]ADZ31615.1 hypothetical protein PaVLD_ORF108L [Planktothrix phage PaV-LD]